MRNSSKWAPNTKVSLCLQFDPSSWTTPLSWTTACFDSVRHVQNPSKSVAASARASLFSLLSLRHVQSNISRTKKKYIRWYPQQLKTPLAYAVGEISRTKKNTYPLRCISITLFTSSRFYSLTLKAMKI